MLIILSAAVTICLFLHSTKFIDRFAFLTGASIFPQTWSIRSHIVLTFSVSSFLSLPFHSSPIKSSYQQQRLLFLAAKGWIKSTCIIWKALKRCKRAERRTPMTLKNYFRLENAGWQCRINHVADVANATGLRPQRASGSTENFFSPSVVK